ncbi:hypothetical protein DFH11DRAFT_131799 [Phellopilus nigrolimitatus]|nr:hypothetical protein DFH11DRAFT_131799 [Phellopilus nigrolimitatus]
MMAPALGGACKKTDIHVFHNLPFVCRHRFDNCTDHDVQETFQTARGSIQANYDFFMPCSIFIASYLVSYQATSIPIFSGRLTTRGPANPKPTRTSNDPSSEFRGCIFTEHASASIADVVLRQRHLEACLRSAELRKSECTSSSACSMYLAHESRIRLSLFVTASSSGSLKRVLPRVDKDVNGTGGRDFSVEDINKSGLVIDLPRDERLSEAKTLRRMALCAGFVRALKRGRKKLGEIKNILEGRPERQDTFARYSPLLKFPVTC